LKNRNSFTLIELIITVIIVGILASAAVPMLRGYINRAKRAEAITVMGIIRAAERVYYTDHDIYQGVWQGDAPGLHAIGLCTDDLNGKYFSNRCYEVYFEDGWPNGFSVFCYPSLSEAPNRRDVNWLADFEMQGNGDIIIQ